MRFAITTSGTGGEQQINAPTALPTNSVVPRRRHAGRRDRAALSERQSRGHQQRPDHPPVADALAQQQLPRQKPVCRRPAVSTAKSDSFRIFGRALSGAEIRDLVCAHPALAHRYSFNTSTTPCGIPSAWRTARSWATPSSPTTRSCSTALTGSYVNLPGGLVSGSSAVTLEFWATFGANGNWARVADFGNISGSSGIQYFFFSPHTRSAGSGWK